MDPFIILITYGILFLGELGDKTQLIVFNLALDYNKFFKVGIGATLGFAVIVTIGILFGSFITVLVPLSLIKIISSIVFIIIGIFEARNIKSFYLNERKMKSKDKAIKEFENNEGSTSVNESSRFSWLKKNPYLAGFGFIFLMELGDKTQILTISLASIHNAPLEVWLGAFLALTSVAWIGIFAGAFIARKVPKFYLKVLSITIFILVGILVLTGII
ncbi:MAG: TMEM165/GDT1 family protein [Candidatus Lokiarchaeota archaeon]|nr:TMEM165/GDT1 family protein [Candidatus Lokiarchaeota archaeon]